jgi:hypothetical protein
MIDSQMAKLRKTYSIMKYIHRQYPMSKHLKNNFFNRYMWLHLYRLALVYVLLVETVLERLAAFYRRCMRLVNSLFQFPQSKTDTSEALGKDSRTFKRLNRR